MNDKSSKYKGKINFNEMLMSIGEGSDFIIKIDTLYKFASEKKNTQAINMIRNAVRLKIPELHEIFTKYITLFSRLSVDAESGYLRVNKNKNISENPSNFQEWIIQNYDLKELTESMKLQFDTKCISMPAQDDKRSKKVSNKKKTKKPKLILISRRGKRLDKETLCSNCGRVGNLAWQYSESNRGKVTICCKCKPTVFERSFGKKDVMDYAILGGGFEGNRRKH